MLWEHRLVLENTKRLLEKQSGLPIDDGEVDFAFLSALESVESGKMSLITQGLLQLIGENREGGEPAQAMEHLAALFLTWAAHLRAQKQYQIQADPTVVRIGMKVRVRLPDHQPLFVGELQREGMVWIELLQKEYRLEDVQIVPSKKTAHVQTNPPIKLQENLRQQLDSLSDKIYQKRG